MKNKGFTIIEILVTVMIVGILASIGINFYVNQQKLARDATRKSDLSLISSALTSYYAVYKIYPLDAVDTYSSANKNYSCFYTSLKYKGAINNLTSSGIEPGYCFGSIVNWIPELAPTFISSLPFDPNKNETLISQTEFNNVFASSSDTSSWLVRGGTKHNVNEYYTGHGNNRWFYAYSTKLGDRINSTDLTLPSRKYFLLSASLENYSDNESISNRSVSYFGVPNITFNDIEEWPSNTYVLLSY